MMRKKNLRNYQKLGKGLNSTMFKYFIVLNVCNLMKVRHVYIFFGCCSWGQFRKGGEGDDDDSNPVNASER